MCITSATSMKQSCITPPSVGYTKHARTLRHILEYSHITDMSGGKKAFAVKKKRYRRVHVLINRLKEETDKHCKKMFKRLRRKKYYLLTFLEVGRANWCNNSTERGIRSRVILDSNSYGIRSEEDTLIIAMLMSVKQICKTKNDNFLDVMRAHLIKTRQKTT